VVRQWQGLGALDTAVTIGGENKAGVEWFIINPGSNKIVKQGYLALENNNLIYPALAVTQSGRGVMAFTVVGDDYYPSAGYASIDAIYGVGDIHIAAEGLGPADGYTVTRPLLAIHLVLVGVTMVLLRLTETQSGLHLSTSPKHVPWQNIWPVPLGAADGTRTALGNWLRGSLRSSLSCMSSKKVSRSQKAPAAPVHKPNAKRTSYLVLAAIPVLPEPK